MNRSTNITSSGIKKVLKNYKYTDAFAEYMWNGFDAKASIIEINYKSNEIGKIEYIIIKDNGNGINTSKLSESFDKFYDSNKSIEIESPKHTSVIHGKNGVGRLTFFTFANAAQWKTCYDDNGLNGGVINIRSDNIKLSESISIDPPFDTPGTSVQFIDVTISESQLSQEVIPFIKEEFCWFLELNSCNDYKILVNNVNLDYSDIVIDKEEFIMDENHLTFEIKYVQWKNSLIREQSKFYYLSTRH